MLDAPHVDLHPFYARYPRLGAAMRYAGYLALIVVFFAARCPSPWAVPLVFVLLLLLWLLAWRLHVGALWRTSIVAALLLAALNITMGRLS